MRRNDVVFVFAMAMVVALLPMYLAPDKPVADPNLSSMLDCVVHIQSSRSEGSGTIVSKDGIILTSRHVLKDANDFTVTLRNGLTYHAKVVYIAPERGIPNGPDLGFLKVDYYHPTRYLSLRPDRPKLGDVVWCIGHPYGKDGCPWSMTRGIVSAIDRDCQGAYGNGLTLQVDASAYPGNSGGPVTDSEGRVVGVLVGGLAGREGLSICIPAGAAAKWLDVFRAMLETGR